MHYTCAKVHVIIVTCREACDNVLGKFEAIDAIIVAVGNNNSSLHLAKTLSNRTCFLCLLKCDDNMGKQLSASLKQ